MTAIAIKEVKENGDLLVRGKGVFFDRKDIDGDSFAKDTDFQLDLVPSKPVFYRHRGDAAIKERIGSVIATEFDDDGIWFEAQLDGSRRYMKAVKRLIDLGVMGMSTGTAPHMIDKKETGLIETWPIIELSLTPTPAEPHTIGVQALKEMALALEEIESTVESQDEPQTESESDDSASSEAPVDESSDEDVENKQSDNEDKDPQTEPGQKGVTIIMAEEKTLEQRLADTIDGLTMRQDKAEEGVKSLSEQMTKLLDAIEGNSRIMGAGYVTQDGGDADKHVKSFGDFLMAVYRKDVKRLSTVYKATKDLGEGSGTTGGYLVPEEYSTSLLQVAHMNNEITSRVQVIPVSRDSGRWPALDQYITPTAGSGQTATAAGVVATPKSAGQELDKTEPSFEMLEWRLHKVGGYTEVDNELLDDSPMSIEALLRGLFVVAIGAKNERNILRGSGVGEPLGILNSTAFVNVTPATDNSFTWPDVGNMFAKYRGAGGTPYWLIHQSVWPDIMSMESSTGATVWQANAAAGSPATINGIGILSSEHLPQANNSGNVVLADLTAYVMWQRSGISVDFSEHAAFRADQGAWRFTQRTDGKPWLRVPITLADPQGSYQVSPFVVHND